MQVRFQKLFSVSNRAAACLTMLVSDGCGEGTSSSLPRPTEAAVITVDTLTRFQTMTGWEASSQSGELQPGFKGWQNQLFDLAVNDLGINRLRMPITAGAENPHDHYADMIAGRSDNWRCERYLSVNDNNDPRVINPAGFQFSAMDTVVKSVILPMRQRLQARGERLYLNLNYVAFIRQCPAGTPYVHDDPAEYAEMVLAAFLHFRRQYGFVPDAVEIILEPDNVSPPWTGSLIGQSIVATAARLAAEGFRPDFVGPSNTNASSAVDFADDMYRVAGVAPLLKELAYHRYAGASDEVLLALAERGRVGGARTAMLEHIGSSVEDLYKDLTLAQVSAWQQFVLAFPTADNGAQYYPIVDGKPVMGNLTRYLRQYFRYVRMGAVRVGARSDTPQLRPVAFRNVGGRLVVVIHIDREGPIEVRGLAPGRYGTSVTTTSATGVEQAEKVVGANGILTFTATATGVATVYRQ